MILLFHIHFQLVRKNSCLIQSGKLFQRRTKVNGEECHRREFRMEDSRLNHQLF